MQMRKMWVRVGTAMGLGVLMSSTLSVATDSMASKANAAGGCDLDRGGRVFQQCAACHSFAPEAPHSIGPNLSGVVGRKIASAAGYEYSPALRQRSGESWDIPTLSLFLESPLKFASGTRMAYSGIRQPVDRAAVICYLQTLKPVSAAHD